MINPKNANTKEKGQLLIVLGIIFVVILIGAFYLFNKNQKPTAPVVKNSPTPFPYQIEIHDFPIYPQANFIKKDQLQTDFTAYTWQTADDFDMVNSWYKEDKTNSGWSCTGASGSYNNSRDAQSRTTCTKNDFKYDLLITSDKTKTEITLQIPNDITPFRSSVITPLSTAWDQTLNTYSNSFADLTFQYPAFFIVTSQLLPDEILSIKLATPEVPINIKQQPYYDFNYDDQNSMSISFDIFDNHNNGLLADFLKDYYSAVKFGPKDTLYTRLQQNLQSTDTPIKGSFIYQGTLGETPTKKIYFNYNKKFYEFTLFGGNNAGQPYSKDAEAIFDKVIASIKFL